MELALACDLRVMAKDAVIGMPETRIGLIPDVGGSSRLPQVIGLGRAKEMVMTGKMIGGDEAERIGLVNRVATIEKLGPETQKLIDELLACAPAGRRPRQARDGRLGAPGAGRDARARGRDAGAVRALGRTSPRAPRRSRRSASPSSAGARTRPRGPRRGPRPRSTTSSPSSRNVRVEPSSSSIGSSPFQLSSSSEPRWSRSGPGDRPASRAGRRCAGEAPLTVRWAICWATLQYSSRRVRAGDDGAVELELERDVERPRVLAAGRASGAGSCGSRRGALAGRRAGRPSG